MSVVHKWIRTRAMREKWLYIRMQTQLVQSVKRYLAVQEEADAAAALIDSLETRVENQNTLLRRVQWELVRAVHKEKQAQWELVRAVHKEKQAVERADSLERKLESQDIMMRSFVIRAGDLVESHHCVKCQITSHTASPIEIERRALLRRVLGE